MKRWKRWDGEAGLSLVEATIILMVLAILTAVMSPSITSYVDDARRTKAKEDCEAIGVSVARLLRDTGLKFLLENGQASLSARFNKDNKVNLLVSDGDTPFNNAEIPGATEVSNIDPASVDWDDALGNGVGSMYDHLVANNAGYESPFEGFDTLDPGEPTSRGEWMLGWRGAYLSGIVGPDPWGFRYAVNSVYLGAAVDATASIEGNRARGWSYDTMCVSAGPDARIQVNFEDTKATQVSGAGGGTSLDGTGVNDDIIYVISGYGR